MGSATMNAMHRRLIASRLVKFAPSIFLALTGPALAGPTYPVSAQLELAPPTEQHCLKSPKTGATDCSVVERAHAAFSAAVARMFTSTSPPDLRLVLTVTTVDVLAGAGGAPELVLGTRVRVLTMDGKQLDEIAADGSTPVLAETSVDAAATSVAEDAARVFELEYARSSAVSNWLVRNDIAPAAAVSIPDRSDRLISVSMGVGMVQGGGDGGVVPDPSVGVAASIDWFVLKATYSIYSSSFRGVLTSGYWRTSPGHLHVGDLGIEAGPAFRITPSIELRAGPGLHYLSGSAGIEDNLGNESFVSPFTKWSPSAFASLWTTFLPFRSGARFFGGLEARAYFFSAVDMAAVGRRVVTANTSFGLVFGVELPWGSSRRGAP